MRCPSCAKAELVHGTHDVPCTGTGESIIVSAGTGDYCPVCGECVLDAGEASRVSEAMLDAGLGR
jgi:HTH-type transcriptional regulator/antitoxin MqsA